MAREPDHVLELSLRVRAADEHRAENALMDLGALSVTLLDADAATPNERALLEPGVGEIPLWPEITLLALFPEDTMPELVLHALESFDDAIDLSQADFRTVADQDWERAWMDQYVPLQFGRRTWIVPWNMDPPPEARDGVIVRLDPGLAFGSGTHPTTALCLRWLDSLVLRGKTVLPLATGGSAAHLLALDYALKPVLSALGARHVLDAVFATDAQLQRHEAGGYVPEADLVARLDRAVAPLAPRRLAEPLTSC